jgi:hypothetical protein
MRKRQKQFKLRFAWRSVLMRCAALAIGCQFLVPAGYMPGAFANGTPFVLCHMYTGALAARTPAADAHAHAGMHHDAGMHHAAPAPADTAHDDHTNAEAWEHCPLGALSATAALAPSFALNFSAPAHERVATTRPAPAGIVAPIDLRARAPPAGEALRIS